MSAGDDLQLLADFAASLQTLSRLSEGVAKLYQLCNLFHRVADLYVGAKVSEQNDLLDRHAGAVEASTESAQPTMTDDIDGYLSTIGLAPRTISDSNADATMLDGQFDYLNDWYMGNSSLVGFLEQDMAFLNAPDISGSGGASTYDNFGL